MKRVPVSTLVAATLLALAAARPGTSGVPDTPARTPTPAPAPAPAPDPLAGPLSERISGKKGLDDVRIDVDWPRDTTPTSARIYGNGVGIWDRRLQFALSRRKVISALEVLRNARFGAMPGGFGSDSGGEEVEGPLRLHGKVVLRIGPYTKRVAQMVDGDQSAELAAAARKILDICAGPGAKGKGAASLEEGLRLVAEKRLVPEVLSVVVHRRAAPGAADAEGWILRLGGRTAVDRRMPAGQPPPLARRLVLSEADFMALVKALSDENVATLPGNLYASAYTDLRIELLDRSHNVAARQFLNVTPETHGARQRAFDRVLEALRYLHERTQRDGKPVEELTVPPGAGSAAERTKEAEREEREKARKVTPRRATSSSQEGP